MVATEKKKKSNAILPMMRKLVIMFASYVMLRLAPGDPTRSSFMDNSSVAPEIYFDDFTIIQSPAFITGDILPV